MWYGTHPRRAAPNRSGAICSPRPESRMTTGLRPRTRRQSRRLRTGPGCGRWRTCGGPWWRTARPRYRCRMTRSAGAAAAVTVAKTSCVTSSLPSTAAGRRNRPLSPRGRPRTSPLVARRCLRVSAPLPNPKTCPSSLLPATTAARSLK